MRNHIIVGGAIVVAIIVGVLAFLYSNKNVSNASPSAATENTQAAVAVPFTEIAEGTRSTVSTRANYLITSADQLTKLWAMIDATGTPPTIDFKNNSIIAVFAGNESVAGSAIAVTKIEDTNARTVSVTITEPSGACALKQKTAAPYEIISLPATTLPLTHQDTIATTTECK